MNLRPIWGQKVMWVPFPFKAAYTPSSAWLTSVGGIQLRGSLLDHTAPD